MYNNVAALGEVEPTKATVDTPATEPVLSDTPSKRHYPTISERLAAVDANIAHLTQLNESRATLLAKTQTTLEERQVALKKSMEALKTALEKKDRLVELQNRPETPPVVKAPKLSPEERQQARISALEHARAARKAKKDARVAEEAKIRELVEKLRASGRSVDELLESFASHEE